MHTNKAPRLLTINQAAHTLAVSVTTLRRMINRREIAYVKVKGQLRFTDQLLLDYIEAQTVKPQLIGDRRRF